MPADASHAILDRITPRNVTQWQAMGQVIQDLKKLSKASPEGTPWLDVVGERASDIGYPVSKVHLFRVNRVFDFATHLLEELNLPKDLLSDAKIGTLDAVERLFRFEEEAGTAAFMDAIDPDNRATLQEINQRYLDCKARNPGRRDPKQLGAERRYADKAHETTVETGKAAGHQLPTGPADDEIWISVMRIVVARVEETERAIQERDRRIEVLVSENRQLRMNMKRHPFDAKPEAPGADDTPEPCSRVMDGRFGISPI